jgi:hypothetical protein
MRWKTAELKHLFAMLVVFRLLLPDRVAHLKLMLQGILDGLRGRLGRPGWPRPSQPAVPVLLVNLTAPTV